MSIIIKITNIAVLVIVAIGIANMYNLGINKNNINTLTKDETVSYNIIFFVLPIAVIALINGAST